MEFKKISTSKSNPKVIKINTFIIEASLVAQMVKNLPLMQENWV